MPKLTQKVLDDASVDMVAYISGRVADRFARVEGAAFLNGSGVKQPRGILTIGHSTLADFTRPWGQWMHVVSGSATTLTSDSVIALLYSLRAPYRPGASWCMARDTLRVIAQLKDGQGRYLYNQSLTAGEPDMLLGFPITIAEDMPAIASGSIPIIFGDFARGYTVVDRIGIRLLRDPFSAKPFVLLYTYVRVGGDAVDYNALRLLVIST
jgi:HK97 family phage major capsid protein